VRCSEARSRSGLWGRCVWSRILASLIVEYQRRTTSSLVFVGGRVIRQSAVCWLSWVELSSRRRHVVRTQRSSCRVVIDFSIPAPTAAPPPLWRARTARNTATTDGRTDARTNGHRTRGVRHTGQGPPTRRTKRQTVAWWEYRRAPYVHGLAAAAAAPPLSKHQQQLLDVCLTSPRRRTL